MFLLYVSRKARVSLYASYIRKHEYNSFYLREDNIYIYIYSYVDVIS